MGPIKAINSGLRKLWDFDSRASRSEFWWMWAATLVSVASLQTAILIPLMRSVLRTPDSKDFVLSNSNVIPATAGAPLLLFGLFSTFLITLLLLSVTARRFVDCDWPIAWFKIAAKLNVLLAFVILISLSFHLIGWSDVALKIGMFSFILAFPTYASVMWSFWIGFIKGKTSPQPPAPHTNEVPS